MGSPSQGLFPRADLGYYSVGGDRFYYHKFEALEFSAASGRRPKFHWQDEFWAAIDWTKEPLTSLEDLYRQRAEQLRNRYDYIILSYSGGADSWNVLRVFDKWNIHLDEIATYHDYSFTKSETSNLNAEVFKLARPIAFDFVQRHPHTEFSMHDIRDALFDALQNLDDDQLMKEYYAGVMSVGMPGRAHRWLYIEPKYREMIESGKKVCLLKGWDKAMPAWSPQAGRYGYWFNDHFTAESRKHAFNPHLPFDEEMFYWTVEMPDLLLKGLHTVKKKLDALPPNYKDPVKINFRSPRRTYTTNRHGSAVSIPVVNSWLYPGWSIDTFTVGKDGGGDDFLSEKDFWVKDRMEEDLIKKWRKILGHGFNLYKKLYARGHGPFNSRSSVITTQTYYL